jgi:hypothetical protein
MRDGNRHAQSGEQPGDLYFVARIDERKQQRYGDRVAVGAPHSANQVFNFTITQGFQNLTCGRDSLSNPKPELGRNQRRRLYRVQIV